MDRESWRDRGLLAAAAIMTGSGQIPDDYMIYPHRRLGYDHNLYEWSNMHARPPVVWPDNKRVAIFLCVSLEWFPLTPADAPFRAPGHMVTPYPDYRHYTARDYGNRVGVWRILDAFEKAGVKASFAVNAAVAERYPEIITALNAAGHELIAHSTDMNGTIDSSLSIDDERELITAALIRLQRATGTKPTGWLSIARSQSMNTSHLLAENGISYCCDWVNDELPYRFANGLINLPLNHELSDRQIITVQQKSADSWAESIRDAFSWLSKEATQMNSGRLLPLHLTPYIMGLPYRIGALENLLFDFASRDEAFFARGDELVKSWAGQA